MSCELTVLVVGDIVGRPGREALAYILPKLKDEYHPHFIMANAENAAGGQGITPAVVEELLNTGCDLLTTGNHIWRHKEILPFLDKGKILRPINYPPAAPGRGATLINIEELNVKIGIINVSGRVFLDYLDCPFRRTEEELQNLTKFTSIIIVDMHAEATSEKQALGWFLSGRVSAVVGTHTHVQTADERILGGNTAYITDVGMVGVKDSVIGMRKDIILKQFLSGVPLRLEVAKGEVEFCGVLIKIDTSSGKAKSILRIREEVNFKPHGGKNGGDNRHGGSKSII